MSVDTINFKRSLSHQIKKLMCYNRHLNRKKIIRPTEYIYQQKSNPNAAIINSDVSTADYLRTRYESNRLSLQHKLPAAVDRSMPKENFGDIVMGMMTMPELPPFGSVDIQQIVRLSDVKSEKRTECDRLTQSHCKQTYYNNDATSGNCFYPPESCYRRTFPPPSGADKPAFLDFPSSPQPPRQRDFLSEGIEPHSVSLADFQEPPPFLFEKAKQKVHRNSAFQIYHRDEPTKTSCNKHRPVLDENPSSYSLDFPVPSGADKFAFLDCPTVHPTEESSRLEKPKMSCHHERHVDISQSLFPQDNFDENVSKPHCGNQGEIPHLIQCNQHMKRVNSTCAFSSQINPKRKACTRTLNDASSSTCCHTHQREHHNSCERRTLSSLMDLSNTQERNLSDFEIGDPFSLESSIHSPASTINSADISFDLSQGLDFQQDKPSTSVPQRRGPGRPRKPENERKRKPTKSIPLWKFLLNMLHDPATCPELVRWEDTSKGTFRIVRSDLVAAKWGMRKDNTKMNYEKFSRAMRYYYKQHIFEAVPGKRLVYQFGRAAKEWRPKNMDNPNFEQPELD